MKLRNVYLTKMLCAAIVAGFSLLVQSAAWAQTLTGSANPPSGGAGVNNSYLTGSAFPAGTITGATVQFGTSCAAPSVASGPVIQVTAIGTLRRFQFLIPASLSPGAYKVWVSGTAGGAPFNTLNTPSCSAVTVTATVAGTASLGAAIAGGQVTLVDANGVAKTATTASDGTFTLNAEGLTPPYLVRVVTTTSSGSFPAGTTLYSVSADGNQSTRINVHVLSDLILRSFYSAQGIDPDTAFATPLGANAAPTPTAVQAVASLVIPTAQLWLNNFGITATPGAPSNGSINLISSPFTAYPAGVTPTSGLDAVLHLITSETIDPGNVTGVTVSNGTISETITPAYSGGDISLNTMTTNASTGVGSTESFTGLVITGANQSVVAGIDAQLTALGNTINTNGSALTGSEVLPFYAPDYLNDGQDATQAANAFAANVAGATVTSVEVQSIKSLNTTTNVADVIVAFTIIKGGQSGSGTQEFIFKNESATWLEFGDQLIAFISATSQDRTSQGGSSMGPGVTNGTYIFAGVQAPTSFGVKTVTVSGAGNIWPGGSASETLTHGSTLLQNGQTFDEFFGLSQPLGNILSQLPTPGTTFTFNLTTASSGSPQYTAQNNAWTTEGIAFSGISSTKGSGPLSSILGQTITYNWSLPTTFAIGQVSLSATINDGPGGPSTLSCNINANGQLGVTSTSGSITFPANMSACGLSASDTIKQVSLFLEVDGVNGQVDLVQLSYPY